MSAGGDDGLFRTYSLWGLRVPKTAGPGLIAEPPTRTVPLEKAPACPKGMLISPNGHTLVLWYSGSGAVVWNPADGKRRPSPRFGSPPMSLALSPDGRVLAGGLLNRSMRFFDLESGRELGKIEGLEAPPATLALNGDGRRAASAIRGGAERSVRVWEISGGKPVSEFKCLGVSEVEVLCFNLDGDKVAAGMGDGTIQMFDVSSGGLIRMMTGHRGAVRSIVFGPGGRLLASGGDDGTVRLWRLSDGGQEKSFRGHSRPVRSIAFDPKGDFVVSAGKDVLLRETATDGNPRVLKMEGMGTGPVAWILDGGGVICVDGSKREVWVWDLRR